MNAILSTSLSGMQADTTRHDLRGPPVHPSRPPGP